MTERELRLTAGGAAVTIDIERGGRLASWSVEGRELLVGPPTPDDRSIRWGCFLMAPWAGRLADGRFRGGDGRTLQVPRTHGRHAIHGLVWDHAWAVETATADRATLACDIPGDLWPPGGSVRHEVMLAGDRLGMVANVRAAEAGPDMPVALGWHPWLRRDGLVALRVDADQTLETVGMIPTGRVIAVARSTDLRHGPRLGRRRLDHAYVAARSPAVLSWPDMELTIAWDPSPSTLVVHTPPSSLCVEPQTAWPNAPALEGGARARSGLRILGPGESTTAAMSLTVRRVG